MRVVVFNHITLDGVTQAPGHPDEDRRGGFGRGGWAPPYGDAVMSGAISEDMQRCGALLFGRRTYEHFYEVWHGRSDPNPFTRVLDALPKYVASRTLSAPLPWCNSTLLEGDATEAVARLRQTPGKDVVILGSGELVQALMRRDLVDEYVLPIHPLVLGAGRRVLADAGAYARLELVGAKPTTTGVLIATYRPERVKDRAATRSSS